MDSLATAPLLVFLLGVIAVLVLAVPLVMWLGKRLSQLEIENAHLATEAEQGKQILAAAPDGLFLWNHAQGRQQCSRRLAVLLGLEAGTGATFKDVLAKFADPEARALNAAVDTLHRKGTSFDILLRLGTRTLQATGTRASNLDGNPLDDMMWMRDATHAPRAAVPEQRPGDAEALDHFHQLFDSLPLPVWIRDGGGNVAFSNRADTHVAASRLSAPLAEQARVKSQSVSEPFTIEQDGEPTDFEVTEVPGRGWSGTIGFAMERPSNGPAHVIRDPDARDLNRDQVLENLSTAIAIFGPNRRLVFSNSAYAELWRFDPEWLADEPSFSEILDRLRERRQIPEVADFRAFKEEQAALFNTLERPAETLLHLPDGRTLRAITAPHAPNGLVLSYEDVSDRLDLERSFKTLNAVQRETLDNLFEGLAVFGSDGRLKLSNPAFSALWNFSETILSGEPHMSDVLNATRPLTAGIETWDDEQWRAYVSSQVAHFTARQSSGGRLHLANGTILEFSSVPLPDGAVLLSYLDVSDSARVEAALRQRAEALDQANRLKSEFIANVSYEVRTPLTTLRGFADILAQEFFGKLNDRQKEYCQGIQDSAEGLTNVINDILDMASIEAGMMTLELDTVEIHSMLASVLNLINERARRKALDIEFDCPSDIGWIVADEKRLKQVLFYLLSNAVNVSPPQSAVTLEARRDGAKDDAAVRFKVISHTVTPGDTEQLEIFTGLSSPAGSDGNSSPVQMGAGLGLTLVQRFVELHGGTVDVTSPKGRGTTITCRLPATGKGKGKGKGKQDKPDLSVANG